MSDKIIKYVISVVIIGLIILKFNQVNVYAYQNIYPNEPYKYMHYTIPAPDGNLHKFTSLTNINVYDASGNTVLSNYAITRTIWPNNDWAYFKIAGLRMLDNGDIWVLHQFKHTSEYNNSSYYFEQVYRWDDTLNKYVHYSNPASYIHSHYMTSWSGHGYTIRIYDACTDSYAYRFTGTGSTAVTGSYYSWCYTPLVSSNNRVFIVSGFAGDVFLGDGQYQSLGQHTGYTTSTYPNWYDVIGLNHINIGSTRYNWYSSIVVNDITYYFGDYGMLFLPSNISPVLSVISPSQDGIYSESDTSFIPVITVSDADNNDLTCKYFVDSQTTPGDTKSVTNTTVTQNVSFSSLDMSTLTEGDHFLRFEIYDGIMSVTSSVDIKVDRSSPCIGTVTVTSEDTSITIQGSASDSIAGLDAAPYRYSVGLDTGDWTVNTSYNKNDLDPDTQYCVVFEARDSKGHIAQSSQNIYTKAQIPTITLSDVTAETVEITASDANQALTQYQITTGSMYVSASGALTTTPTWITLTNKKIIVTDLSHDSFYTFQAKAKNQTGIETAFSPSVSTTTLTAVPSVPVIDFTLSQNDSITINWGKVTDAVTYEIEADGIPVGTGSDTNYTHSGLNANTQHTYRVRAGNVHGLSNWSTLTAVNTSGLPKTAGINTALSLNKRFCLVLSDSNVQSFTGKSFTVTYNPNELEVVDLCLLTPESELAVGIIPGGGITITQFTPGNIVFTVNKSIDAGKSGSGVLNCIYFKSKINGQTAIEYYSN